jgi:hypothetical protein
MIQGFGSQRSLSRAERLYRYAIYFGHKAGGGDLLVILIIFFRHIMAIINRPPRSIAVQNETLCTKFGPFKRSPSPEHLNIFFGLFVIGNIFKNEEHWND